mmetsp:Transcript_13209/g.25044  ORF Transcript_13209/g.25044 Transcript_13209/m.25044 type:complete len:203 (+) Transcript_13209:1-609(+)
MRYTACPDSSVSTLNPTAFMDASPPGNPPRRLVNAGLSFLTLRYFSSNGLEIILDRSFSNVSIAVLYTCGALLARRVRRATVSGSPTPRAAGAAAADAADGGMRLTDGRDAAGAAGAAAGAGAAFSACGFPMQCKTLPSSSLYSVTAFLPSSAIIRPRKISFKVAAGILVASMASWRNAAPVMSDATSIGTRGAPGAAAIVK